ncbi:MAG: hypothetical protein GY869_08035, partial [Planctomycetes bacterium]|nr:hypothetical protein [Planctomycetota bacterium]
MILTWLFWIARNGSEKPHWRGRAIYEVMVIIAVYGALDEATQSLVGRHGDIIDWFSDMSGCFLALATLYLFRHVRWWLVFFWTGMLAMTCYPFIQLPTFLRQFEAVYVVTGYSILTLLWWRSICQERRFMFTKRMLWLTVVVLPGYGLIEQGISVMQQRGFSWEDFLCGLGGILIGVICAAAFSQHHLVNAEDDIEGSTTTTE